MFFSLQISILFLPLTETPVTSYRILSIFLTMTGEIINLLFHFTSHAFMVEEPTQPSVDAVSFLGNNHYS